MLEPGGLPKFDSNAALQEQSVRALHALLQAKPIFLLRDVRGSDFGVDAELEVLLGEFITNFRAQVQIKATSAIERNADGAISRSIEVSNLNYLLNGTSGLYILYLSSEDTLWFAWADDERHRLDRLNPGWKQQRTVSLQFRQRLSPESLESIHAKIIRERQMHRQVKEAVASAVSTENIRVQVNAESLQVETPDSAFRLLRDNGFTFVTNGFAPEIIRLAGMLTAEASLNPKVNLALAYAHLAVGSPNAALAHIGRTLISSGASSEERRIAEEIKDCCNCVLGYLELRELTERQKLRAESMSGSTKLLYEIDVERMELLVRRPVAESEFAFAALSRKVALILNDPSVSEPIKLQCRIQLMFCAGWIVGSRLLEEIVLSVMQSQIALHWIHRAPSKLRQAVGECDEWLRQMDDVVAAANALGVPLLVAEALRTRLVVLVATAHHRKFSAERFRTGIPPTQEQLARIEQEAHVAIGHFRRAENLERELAVKMTLADAYEIFGDVPRAEALAAEVEVVANAVGYGRHAANARDMLSGQSVFAKLWASIREDDNRDEDYKQAEMDDGFAEAFAQKVLELGTLPPDRKQNVLQDILNMRLAAAERLSWCRHLQLLQNLFHVHLRETNYAAPCQYVGKCTKHGFESLQSGPDAVEILGHFKAVYCSDCVDRSPKA